MTQDLTFLLSFNFHLHLFVRLELVDHYQAVYQQLFHIKVTIPSKIYTMEHRIQLKCIRMIA